VLVSDIGSGHKAGGGETASHLSPKTMVIESNAL